MLAWIDIETTGLDPDYDEILEVGLEITLDDLTMVQKHSYIVEHPWLKPHDLPAAVQKMHTANGLLAAIQSGAGLPLNQIEARLCDVMAAFGDEKPPMCGSSVHFDAAFIKRYLPRLSAMFHYRHIDVSGLKELVKRWPVESLTQPPVPQSLHRVDPDLTDSIAELCYYRQILWG